MQVIRSLDDIPVLKNPVVTVGSFDGVHLGHHQILEQLTQIAKARNGESVVLSFSPHPQQVLHPGNDFFVINTLEEKIELMEREGVDYLLIVPFTQEFSMMSSSQFIRDILIGKIGATAIVMGPNHSFGRNREATRESITDICVKNGMEVVLIPEFVLQDSEVRSSQIRKYIMGGDIKKAEELLGHPVKKHTS